MRRRTEIRRQKTAHPANTSASTAITPWHSGITCIGLISASRMRNSGHAASLDSTPIPVTRSAENRHANDRFQSTADAGRSRGDPHAPATASLLLELAAPTPCGPTGRVIRRRTTVPQRLRPPDGESAACHQRGQALHELQRQHHQVRGAVASRALSLCASCPAASHCTLSSNSAARVVSRHSCSRRFRSCACHRFRHRIARIAAPEVARAVRRASPGTAARAAPCR